MNTTTSRVRRAAASVAVAAVLSGLMLPLVATPAGAVQPTTTSRLQDQDRYGTAAAVALDTFPDGAGAVVLATGEDFPDALAANGLAGALGAPVLLTLTDDLPAKTAAAIDDLDPQVIYVMGGTEAVSQPVEDQLTTAGYDTERVQGDDRFETAAAAGAAIAATAVAPPFPGFPGGGGVGTTSEGPTAVLANGLGFPDAVSGGPVAYAGHLPVLLTTTSSVPQATLDALESLGIEHVLLVGGTAVVGDAVKAAVEDQGLSTERLAGTDRWGTNVAVNRFAQAEPGYEFGGPTAYLSTGLKFADALAGGPAAGSNAAPLLLTAPSVLPAPTSAYLAENGGAIDDLVAIGGTAAISDAVLTAAADAAELGTNEAFVVTPNTSEIKPISSTPLTNEGRREFTSTGLEAGGTYVVALLDADTVNTSGGTTFSSYSLSDEASTSIETVNGQPAGAAGGIETVQTEATASATGAITFTVDATAADSIYPIVFEDVDGNEQLTLAGTSADEPFGLGGRTAWLPAEAANGSTATGVAVGEVNRTDNYFVAGDSTYLYGAEDRFASAGKAISLAQFEGLLTSGDRLNITYFRTAQSSFDVTTDTIPDSSQPRAATAGTTSPTVTVTWTGSDQPDVVYAVYRDDGDRTLDAGDVLVSPKGATTTRTFDQPASVGTVRYIVVPEGGTSGQIDDRSNTDTAITYLTNAVTPGAAVQGLSNGTTVSTDEGLDLVNAGDELMLHFSASVSAASGATIKVQDSDGDVVTLTNGSSSTWTVSGSSIAIRVNTNAASPVDYSKTATVTGLTGVTAGGATVSHTALRDSVLEDDGPELMLESSSCDVGETTCAIAFNEPVDLPSATTVSNYRFSGAPVRRLSQVTVGADTRTITTTFSGPLAADDEIAPVGVGLTTPAVQDDNLQPSDQDPIAFVAS